MLSQSTGRPFLRSWGGFLCLLWSPLSLVLAATIPNSHSSLYNSDLDSRTLARVRERLDSVARDVWVSGTQTEAYLELDHPQLTVFNPFAESSRNWGILESSFPNSSNRIVLNWLERLGPDDKQFAVIKGGAAGDPASLGYAWMIAQATTRDERTQERLERMIEAEVEWLLEKVPRTTDGAISHRKEVTQLWSDFIYMVPPFLAARGIATSNHSLLLESYRQIKLYRSHLQDPSTHLWRHVRYGSWEDPSLWATGNAWAAAGITRVLATLTNSFHAETYSHEIRDLALWANEIVEAGFARVKKDGLLPNHLDDPYDFSDSASSALLASTTFRLHQLGMIRKPSTTLATAEKIRSKINDKIDPKTGWLRGCVVSTSSRTRTRECLYYYFWLRTHSFFHFPTCYQNPLSWYQRTDQSPEAQAFVILLEAAWRDSRMKRERNSIASKEKGFGSQGTKHPSQRQVSKGQ
ncbi:BZ3500_MvSof-1268-A1-R1_Chr12-1g03678 [Microbotryum saponariae]|uniref:BZ3500_MvSof-1268-A1-R1_Chr12-1g03678 protein n=1 Tax=Microbotryum saponariae TaxID=289078 RepID=A0A2X0LEH3_9BASI|nr:BZ3500_MvSof-1268-A1-R1_Chr12-1g03678 [Microbotryum saponariae]SDA05271.1 BZ3501_MvSof-1269-A2-R1_Chr12-1g03255 [Microbotryum saponariae]